MGYRAFVLAAAIGFGVVTPGLAQVSQEETNEAAAALVDLMSKNDCIISVEQAIDFSFESGISVNALDQALNLLEEKGDVRRDDASKSARLLTGEACAAQAAEAVPPLEQERRATIVRVFEENGCSLTEAQADELLPAAGLDEDRDGYIVRKMMSEGAILFDPDSGTARMTIGACAGGGSDVAGADGPKARVVAAFEAQNCVLTEGLFREAFGAEADTLLPVVEAMFEAGEIAEGPNDAAVLLTGEMCEKRRANRKDTLIAVLEENDCRLSEQDAEGALAAHGMTMDEAEDIAKAMIDAGEARVEGESRSTLVLATGEVCGE